MLCLTPTFRSRSGERRPTSDDLGYLNKYLCVDTESMNTKNIEDSYTEKDSLGATRRARTAATSAGEDPTAYTGEDPTAYTGEDPTAYTGEDPTACTGEDPTAYAREVDFSIIFTKK